MKNTVSTAQLEKLAISSVSPEQYVRGRKVIRAEALALMSEEYRQRVLAAAQQMNKPVESEKEEENMNNNIPQSNEKEVLETMQRMGLLTGSPKPTREPGEVMAAEPHHLLSECALFHEGDAPRETIESPYTATAYDLRQFGRAAAQIEHGGWAITSSHLITDYAGSTSRVVEMKNAAGKVVKVSYDRWGAEVLHRRAKGSNGSYHWERYYTYGKTFVATQYRDKDNVLHSGWVAENFTKLENEAFVMSGVGRWWKLENRAYNQWAVFIEGDITPYVHLVRPAYGKYTYMWNFLMGRDVVIDCVGVENARAHFLDGYRRELWEIRGGDPKFFPGNATSQPVTDDFPHREERIRTWHAPNPNIGDPGYTPLHTC